MAELSAEELQAHNERLQQRRRELGTDGKTSRDSIGKRALSEAIEAWGKKFAEIRPAGEIDACGCERVTNDGQVELHRCELHETERRVEQGKRLNAERRQRAVTNAPKLLRAAGFFLEHTEAKLGDFPEEITKKAREFIEGDEDGLLIKGPVGPGKTHLAAAIAREFLIEGETVVAIMVADLFGRLRASFRDGSTEGEEQIVTEYRRAGIVLVLDDLGFEGSTTPLVISALHRIISARNGNGLVTIATTNLKAKEIEKCYGPAIASRLGCWTQIVVDGPDRRKEEGK